MKFVMAHAPLSAALCLGLCSPALRANDGVDRYRRGYPNVLYHLMGPVGQGAGFRVLPEDQEGGADGDPAFRWAQKQALAVVEVAARHTRQALGDAPFNMAVFDFSAENGDTPVDFGWKDKPRQGALPRAPRGRHPGGSHDGGLNLDLGYYLTSLKGQALDQDYAACTQHYDATQKNAGGEPLDLNMCVGPADRLAVDHQAFFVLELLKLHRDRFAGGLIGESGMDARVQQAVRARLQQWLKSNKYGVTRQHIDDLDALFSHDRWGGWQRYHHHHLHLRIQPFDSTGPLRDATQQLEVEARKTRAGLLASRRKDWPAALDAQLLSYGLERAIEVHTVTLRERPGYRLARVRYRLKGGEWQPPDEASDDQRYIFDLPPGLLARGGSIKVEAELTSQKGVKKILATSVGLPRLDPRLFVAYQPGSVSGGARVKGRQVRAQISYPQSLKPLLTAVRYSVYPLDGGEPVVQTLESAWFAPSGAKGVQRAKLEGFSTVIRRPKGGPVGLVRAELILSGRKAMPLTLWVAEP